jgi:hypothetical protein
MGAGADAAISAVGPRGTGPTTVIQDSVRIIQAMHKTDTGKFLRISASDCWQADAAEGSLRPTHRTQE